MSHLVQVYLQVQVSRMSDELGRLYDKWIDAERRAHEGWGEVHRLRKVLRQCAKALDTGSGFADCSVIDTESRDEALLATYRILQGEIGGPMRYKNNGPVALYVVMDTELGNVVSTHTNLRAARSLAENGNQAKGVGRYVVLTYDQRGTR